MEDIVRCTPAMVRRRQDDKLRYSIPLHLFKRDHTVPARLDCRVVHRQSLKLSYWYCSWHCYVSVKRRRRTRGHDEQLGDDTEVRRTTINAQTLLVAASLSTSALAEPLKSLFVRSRRSVIFRILYTLLTYATTSANISTNASSNLTRPGNGPTLLVST